MTISILIVGLRIARRNDSTFFVQGLTGVPDYLCSPQEQQQLATGKSRKQARKAAKRVGGRSAKKAMAALQRAQADLAVAVRVGDDAAAQNATQRIEAARHQLPAGQLLRGHHPQGLPRRNHGRRPLQAPWCRRPASGHLRPVLPLPDRMPPGSAPGRLEQCPKETPYGGLPVG